MHRPGNRSGGHEDSDTSRRSVLGNRTRSCRSARRDQPFNPGSNSRTPSMLLVKLGGSVITVKSKYRTLRGPDLSRLARELAAAAGPDTVVVHGAGSYGHILAAKHRLDEGYDSPAQLTAVSQVQRDVRAPDLKVVDALLRARLRPAAGPPSPVMRV